MGTFSLDLKVMREKDFCSNFDRVFEMIKTSTELLNDDRELKRSIMEAPWSLSSHESVETTAIYLGCDFVSCLSFLNYYCLQPRRRNWARI
jgi:hypothetical protein